MGRRRNPGPCTLLLGNEQSGREEKTPPDQKAVADSKAGDEAVFDMKEVSLYDEKDSAAISPVRVVWRPESLR